MKRPVNCGRVLAYCYISSDTNSHLTQINGTDDSNKDVQILEEEVVLCLGLLTDEKPQLQCDNKRPHISKETKAFTKNG